MLQALHPHPEDHLHLRLHRARSVILTDQELVEIRAAQRTFEGAYVRTAVSQFSFALIILRIFTSEFYAIGALFAVYGAAVILVAAYRRFEGNRQFFDAEETAAVAAADDDDNGDDCAGPHRRPVTVKKFRTSADSVALLTALSLSAYVSLMVLLWKLAE